MIKVETRFNFKVPNFLMQDDLMHIAEKIFIPTLKWNIDIEQDIQEKSYPPLDEKTIAYKTKHGLSRKILTATSRLRNSFIAKKQGKNTVIVFLNSDRKKIGIFLQKEGVKSKKYGLRFFNFFGVSTRMEEEAIKYLRGRVKEAIKNAK